MAKNRTQFFSLKNFAEILFRLIVFIPFNFFIILIPGLVSFALLVLAWGGVYEIFNFGWALLTGGLQNFFASSSVWMPKAIFSTGIFAISCGVLLTFLMLLFTMQFLIFVASYCRWNFKFVFQGFS